MHPTVRGRVSLLAIACWSLGLIIVGGLLSPSQAFAEGPPARQVATETAQPAPVLPAAALPQPAAKGRTKFRTLAPGVLVDIDPEKQLTETTSTHDIVQLLNVDPNFDWAKNIRFSHDIWALDFSFKPIRFLDVDLPDGRGGQKRHLVWYLVYRLRNNGTKPVRFVPGFVLESKDTGKVYPDAVLPTIVPLIQRREDPNRPLLNTVQITGVVSPSTATDDRSVWGVVTWPDVDPSTDVFSIYVQGLTNAYRWEDLQDGTRQVTRKTLQLNFWRPSDRFHQHEEEVRFGTPEDVDYRWIYR